MNDTPIRKIVPKPRIPITGRELKRLFEMHGTASVPELAKRSGLPYQMVYNLVHGRLATLSNRHYLALFGRPAPRQAPLKVDGSAFRAMADLWLFLNSGATRSDLYRYLLGPARDLRIDHRIFSGKVRSVDAKIEHRMHDLFAGAGVDQHLLEQWLDEFEGVSHEKMIPYARIRPVLRFLQAQLKLHPTAVLNQSVVRYETGVLKQVSRAVFDRALSLKRQTLRALAANRSRDVDNLREAIVGPKPGYTLYVDIADDLRFLNRHTPKGAKAYLGRSPWTYEQGRARRIATWRADRIRNDCERLIRRSPSLRLADLPPLRRQAWAKRLIGALVARSAQLLSRKEGIDFEKRILKPAHSRAEYGHPRDGYTPFDMASQTLGMKRKAFDLMVAGNCEIFRTVGRFTDRWYLPDLYLQELSRKKDFGLVSAKYESMARNLNRPLRSDVCLN